MPIFSKHRNILKKIAFIGLTLLLVAGGSFWEQQVLRVNATVQVLLVSRTAIAFGSVFPGENLTETYTVQLDNSASADTYVTTLSALPGLQNLCPFLDLKSIDAPAEPDTLATSTLTQSTDVLDKWQVTLKTPGIQGQLSQDHDGGIIVSGGDFGCKITVTTDTPTLPSLTLQKTGSIDFNGFIDYTITYNLAGTGTLHNVVITDPLPAGASFVSADAGGVDSAGVISWNLGNLTAPTSGSVHLVVSPYKATFFNAVLDYQPGVSDTGTIRVLDATTNSPVLPNLEFGPFPILNLKDLSAKDGAFVNTSFTGDFGNGIETKTVDDAAQTFVAMGDGGQITVGPSTSTPFHLFNGPGVDFNLYETINPAGDGRDPACVSVTAQDGTSYPLAANPLCGNKKAYKFQDKGDVPLLGVPVNLDSLGVPAGTAIKSINVYDVKDGWILGSTGSPGYDLDALIARVPNACQFVNIASIASSDLDVPVTASKTITIGDSECQQK